MLVRARARPALLLLFLVFLSSLALLTIDYSLYDGVQASLYGFAHGVFSSEPSHPSPTVTHNVVSSPTTPDGGFFYVNFDERLMLNPNIVAHPVRDDAWFIVAQVRQDQVPPMPSAVMYLELACVAKFSRLGNLECEDPPTSLPVLEKAKPPACEGSLKIIKLGFGPRDARVFYGPEYPYTTFGGKSNYACYGQWIQDFTGLVEWPSTLTSAPRHKAFQEPTELRRPPPFGPVQKNWFVFWDMKGTPYVHYDTYPERSFAQLEIDGSHGPDLAPLTREHDDACMNELMPVLVEPKEGTKDGEAIHQATNSLSITLCNRRDPGCVATEDNTFILAIFQHKKEVIFHSTYEPYVILLRAKPPFEIYGISTKPIWIHGRGVPGQTLPGLKDVTPKEQTSMFYLTSLSWKSNNQKHHGFLDDVLFVGFGIEDRQTAAIDLIAADLLRGLGRCGGGNGTEEGSETSTSERHER